MLNPFPAYVSDNTQQILYYLGAYRPTKTDSIYDVFVGMCMTILKGFSTTYYIYDIHGVSLFILQYCDVTRIFCDVS